MFVVGVVGLGSIGLRHAKNCLSLGKTVYGFDLDEGVRQRFSDIGGFPVNQLEKIFSSSHVVIIASPTQYHQEHLALAIDHNCHVFIEKPLSHTTAGLNDLFSIAAKKKLVIFQGLNLRFHPAVMKAKALLDDRCLGEILWARLICSSYLPDWRPHQDYRVGYAANPVAGGVIFDIIHEFDLAYHLLGSAKVLSAHARHTGFLDIPTEDFATVIMQHQDGCYSTVQLDYVTPQRTRKTEVAGTKGKIEVDIINRSISHTDNSGQSVFLNQWDDSINDDYIRELAFFFDLLDGKNDFPDRKQDYVSYLDVLGLALQARKIVGVSSEREKFLTDSNYHAKVSINES